MAKQQTQKVSASTQKFVAIEDIIDNIVMLAGGNACVVIEVKASNFALLSKQEQEAKIYSYAAFLNSLTFPIQILVRNKRVDISSYVKDLEQAEIATKNPMLAHHIQMYRNFIQEMVKTNIVLNKKFYIVITFSYLESGLTGVTLKQNGNNKEQFVQVAKKVLQSKLDSVHGQLRRLTASAKTLEKEELIQLFYDIYNYDLLDVSQVQKDITTPVITTMH